jgi:hypothetical protein
MATTRATHSAGTRLQSQLAACETVKEIIDIAATAEALAVTALGAAVDSAQRGELALSAEQVQVVKAARFAEQKHYEFLTGAGATALTLTFTVPDTAIITDVATFLTTVIGLEEAFIGAYMAAAQIFAVRGEIALVQYALQTIAVEAEHRAHARFYAIGAGLLSGVPNDVAYEKPLFTSLGQAAGALQQLGWIGGSGPAISYPGPSPIDNPGVGYLQP